MPSPSQHARQQARQAAIERMRMSRFSGGRTSGSSDDQADSIAARLGPFIRRQDGSRASADELKNLLSEFRTKSHARKTASAGANDLTTAVVPDWHNLLEQLGTQNFPENLGKWLGSVSPELGISSTSIEELQRLREEIGFRERALNAMLKFTRNELSELESQIDAKKSYLDGRA